MKRMFVLTSVSVALGLSVACAQGDTQSSQNQQISPPPVSSANVFDGVTRADVRALYADMGFVSGGGINFAVSRGFTDWFAAGINIGVMGFSGKTGGTTINIVALPFGVTTTFELLGGDEMDAAGQITQRHATLSAFGGVQGMVTEISMEMESGYYSSTTTDSDSQFYGQVGLVAELPVLSWCSLMPYGSYMFGETSIASYGADILIRPFKNAQNWEISVGTVLQQIEANDDNSLMIMVGVNYTGSEHHRSIGIGPVVR